MSDTHRIEVHVALEGHGVHEAANLVSLLTGTRMPSDPELAHEPEADGPPPEYPGEEVDVQCPECDWFPVFDDKEELDHEASHLVTCSHYKGGYEGGKG